MQIKSGIININKEAGYTSFDVVARLRGILGIKKIGHTGTLDPAATGVLPVCVGSATKVCGLLTDKDKEYEALMRLGVVTDTQDITGVVKQRSEVKVTPEEVSAALMHFVGEVSQIPPMYSALKVQGQKLCDLARKGIEIERKPRIVHIASIDILEMKLPLVRIRVKCSKGTYIRTLCHDVGQMLGCGAAMETLVRTRVADFSLEEALTLDQVERCVKEETLGSALLLVDRLFASYRSLQVNETADHLLANGNKLDASCVDAGGPWEEQELVRMYRRDGRFAGIYQWKEQKFIPYKMFLE